MSHYNKKSIILSFDIEADGPSPLVNNCLMIGICAIDPSLDPIYPSNFNKFVIDSKEWCIKEQDGCVADQKCIDEFWSKNMNIYNHIKKNEKDVKIVMQELNDWIRELQKKYNITKWIAKPSSYDFQWINCLFNKYLPKYPIQLPFSITCISTMLKTCEMLNIKLNNLKTDKLKHTHYALDDAIQQGYMYLRMINEMKKYIVN